MSTNQAIIQKADMALSDLASGGLLEEEQANSFIRKLLVQPTLLRQARTVVMGGPVRQINKIGFGSRILMPATSGVALDEDTSPTNRRSKVTTSQIKLTTNEVIAEVRLPYDVIEDNIEGGNNNFAGPNASHKPMQGGLKDTIVTLMAERAALDLEELALLGDTGSGDAYLALVDGFLAQITSNVVNAAASPIDRTILRNGMKAMPDQYLRNRLAMRHFLSQDNETDYRETVAARETAAGDAVVNGNVPVYAYGVPVEAVSLMPGAQGIFTTPQNLIFGIQRKISIEVDKDITSRVFIIVLTARIDFKIEEEEAAVLYTNIG